MLRIVGHIESLLLRNDCVIIPRFGGFVLREVPASFEETDALFCPPHKEISFNTNLRHTDGLLAESYMQVYDVDYGNASEMLERDVEALEKCLREEKCLDCGKIGSFRLGDEGQLIFTPGESALWNASFYGLETYHFPKLAPLPAEKPEMWGRDAKAGKGCDIYSGESTSPAGCCRSGGGLRVVFLGVNASQGGQSCRLYGQFRAS